MNGLHGLDDYITNSHYSEWIEELVCSECGGKWDARMFREYGRSYFRDEEQAICPDCGIEVKG